MPLFWPLRDFQQVQVTTAVRLDTKGSPGAKSVEFARAEEIFCRERFVL